MSRFHDAVFGDGGEEVARWWGVERLGVEDADGFGGLLCGDLLAFELDDLFEHGGDSIWIVQRVGHVVGHYSGLCGGCAPSDGASGGYDPDAG